MKKNGHEYVYIRYSKESPHLPEFMTDTLDEMAKAMKTKKTNISAYIQRGSNTYARVRIS